MLLNLCNEYLQALIDNNLLSSTLIDQWFTQYKLSVVKNSTILNKQTTAIPNLRKYLGQYPLMKITPIIYQEFLNTLFTDNYSKSTLETVNIVAKLIFKYAIENELTDRNPAQHAVVPKRLKTIDDLKEEALEQSYLTKKELLQFWEYVKTKTTTLDYSIFLTLSYTGMRIGELLALQWEDIDFINETISINKTLFRHENRIEEYELTPPKTKKSNRIILVDSLVLEQLSVIQFEQEEIKKIFPAYHDTNFVFAKLEGNFCGYPESRRAIGFRLKRYLQKLGNSKPLTLHKFRHTHVSLLTEAGVDLQAIQERIRHEDSKTMRKVYLHITNYKRSK
ncbi:tyrosine-type recombinase/integrase [Enterococcus quebecensis]|uniref:tyrosine-type recombinase/integrase n=1 Tax=Enterococcus quebecensis TaxID=903983 RepID=UPI0009205303|nr:site-specific integrase [Enterococcus quebecensis]OJG73254.1 integrase [Enterococcus quebecensis]